MDIKERVQKPDARAIIDSVFPKPEFTLEEAIVAPPQTENYAEIGAAFNYILTFWIARNHNSPEIARWPTKAGISTIEREYEDYISIANEAVENAEEAFAIFLENGRLTDELCLSALNLARIEAAYHGPRPRALNLLNRLGNSNQDDIEDLKTLYRTIPSQFQKYENITVNPNFGLVEFKIGGVDVDLICDGLLLDIKTTKKLRLNISYWRKLVAYATFWKASNEMRGLFEEVNTSVPAVDSVGIYYSRYGLIWEVPTERIYTKDKYKKFQDWFLNNAIEE